MDPILKIQILISFANAEVQFFEQGDFVDVQASLFVLVVVEEAILILIVEQNPIRACHVRSVINDSITAPATNAKQLLLGCQSGKRIGALCLAKKEKRDRGF